MRPPKRAYIFVLPSLFTLGNLFCGFYSIFRSFDHDFEKAAYAIFLAGVFDLLDGRVARITGSTSEFGVEFDSIADVISFGLAPATMAYFWVLQPLGQVGWAVAFLFLACGSMRLARFNASVANLPKSFFLGLPIPAAAMTIASLFLCTRELSFVMPIGPFMFLVICLSLLMVSNIRFRSMKDFDLRHRRSFFRLVPMVLVIAFVGARHEIGLAVLFLVYVAWGPVREACAGLGRHRLAKLRKLRAQRNR